MDEIVRRNHASQPRICTPPQYIWDYIYVAGSVQTCDGKDKEFYQWVTNITWAQSLRTVFLFTNPQLRQLACTPIM